MKGKETESFTSLSYSNDSTRDTCVAGLSEISYSIVTGLARCQYLNFRSQPQARGSSPSGTSLTTSGILPSNGDELLELSTDISDIHCSSLWGRTHMPDTASHVFHWTIAFHLSSRLWNLEKLPHQAAAASLPLTTAVPAAPPWTATAVGGTAVLADRWWFPSTISEESPFQLLLATLS